ncbi:hypothetical protein NM208_g16484 [Fusarium decemcellulare]|uniref:Uncharacterized protein n=1 Tax=Fusarium decemcellulare TaxID=57161 RepID=A0ACC1RBG1_9HYPO|nr:hypothetical protein NM208_g16484 [Fusarium decemcellulare]
MVYSTVQYKYERDIVNIVFLIWRQVAPPGNDGTGQAGLGSAHKQVQFDTRHVMTASHFPLVPAKAGCETAEDTEGMLDYESFGGIPSRLLHDGVGYVCWDGRVLRVLPGSRDLVFAACSAVETERRLEVGIPKGHFTSWKWLIKESREMHQDWHNMMHHDRHQARAFKNRPLGVKTLHNCVLHVAFSLGTWRHTPRHHQAIHGSWEPCMVPARADSRQLETRLGHAQFADKISRREALKRHVNGGGSTMAEKAGALMELISWLACGVGKLLSITQIGTSAPEKREAFRRIMTQGPDGLNLGPGTLPRTQSLVELQQLSKLGRGPAMLAGNRLSLWRQLSEP